MANKRIYYHVVFSVARGKPVFLDDGIDIAFKQLTREIAHQKGWLLLEIEKMPNHVYMLLAKAPS
jgi:REP element-mobilizing transposase RayT